MSLFVEVSLHVQLYIYSAEARSKLHVFVLCSVQHHHIRFGGQHNAFFHHTDQCSISYHGLYNLDYLLFHSNT